MRIFSKSLLALTILILMIFSIQEAQACPGCKLTKSTSNGDVKKVQEGFSYGVLFMLAIPLGLIAGVGRYSYKAICKIEEQRADLLKKSSS